MLFFKVKKKLFYYIFKSKIFLKNIIHHNIKYLYNIPIWVF